MKKYKIVGAPKSTTSAATGSMETQSAEGMSVLRPTEATQTDFQPAAAFTCIAPHSDCEHQQADCVLVPGGSARGEQAGAIMDLLAGETTRTAELKELEENRERDRAHWLQCMAENVRLREALELIASPKRADGTYNRSREACEVLAGEALRLRDSVAAELAALKAPTVDTEKLVSEVIHYRELVRELPVIASTPVFRAMSDGLKDYQVADAIADAVRAALNKVKPSDVARPDTDYRDLYRRKSEQVMRFAKENEKLRQSLRLVELQRYGFTNAWASCDWRKCEKHGIYARGGNWGAIEGKDGAVCPWCNAAELTKESSDDNVERRKNPQEESDK